jgi:hypothetical protein
MMLLGWTSFGVKGSDNSVADLQYDIHSRFGNPKALVISFAQGDATRIDPSASEFHQFVGVPGSNYSSSRAFHCRDPAAAQNRLAQRCGSLIKPVDRWMPGDRRSKECK